MNTRLTLIGQAPEEPHPLLAWNRSNPWAQILAYDPDHPNTPQSLLLHKTENPAIETEALVILPSGYHYAKKLRLHPKTSILSLADISVLELKKMFPHHPVYRGFCSEASSLASGVVLLYGPDTQDRALWEHAFLSMGETYWLETEHAFEEHVSMIKTLTQSYMEYTQTLMHSAPWAKTLIHGLSKKLYWS